MMEKKGRRNRKSDRVIKDKEEGINMRDYLSFDLICWFVVYLLRGLMEMFDFLGACEITRGPGRKSAASQKYFDTDQGVL